MATLRLFSRRLKEMREKRRLSPQELADRAQTTYQTIWRIERGLHKEPGIYLAKRVAQALGVTTDYLIGTNEPDEDAEPVPVRARGTPPRHAVPPAPRRRGTPVLHTPPEPGPTTVQLPLPEPSRQPLLCPQCVLSMVPDGHGYVCPACRYQVAGDNT